VHEHTFFSSYAVSAHFTLNHAIFYRKGAEATVFAVISTFIFLASQISLGLGTSFQCGDLSTSNKEFNDGVFSRVKVLTWISGFIQLAPFVILFIKLKGVDLIADSRSDAAAQLGNGRGSWWGAFVFSVLFLCSVLGFSFGLLYFAVVPSAC
jgi:hypothetical protein